MMGKAIDWTAVLGNLLLLQNIWVEPIQYNDPFWTLAVEAQLYLLYPLLLGCVHRFGMLRSTLAVMFINVVTNGFWAATGSTPGWTLVCSAWFPWVIGFWIAEREHNGGLPWIRLRFLGMGLLASVAIAVGLHFRFQNKIGQDAFWGIASGIVMIWGLTHFRKVVEGRNGSLRLLAQCGLISYSLYLFHRPFQFLIRDFYERYMGPVPGHLGLFAAGMVACVMLAWVCYKAFEHPFLPRSGA